MVVHDSLLSSNLTQVFVTALFGTDYGMGIQIEDETWGLSGADLGFASNVQMNILFNVAAILLVADAGADTDWTFERLLD